MGQHEIMEILKKNPNGMASSEIAEILDTHVSTISKTLRTMEKWGDVEIVRIEGKIRNRFIYAAVNREG